MNRRGPLVAGIGLVMILASFGIVFALIPSGDLVSGDELLLGDLLGDVFDHVSDESVIFPGGSAVFSYSGQGPDAPLLWGVQIADFEDGDEIAVHISNVYGDDLGSVRTGAPVAFDTVLLEGTDPYNFRVQNTGDRTVAVVMVFDEDPTSSGVLGDSGSLLAGAAASLIVSGILFVVGMIVAMIGAVLSLADWRRKKSA